MSDDLLMTAPCRARRSWPVESGKERLLTSFAIAFREATASDTPAEFISWLGSQGFGAEHYAESARVEHKVSDAHRTGGRARSIRPDV